MNLRFAPTSQAILGRDGRVDAHWERWFGDLARAVNAASGSADAEQAEPAAVSLVQGQGIAITGTGTQDSPWVVRLRDLRDSGTGDALVKITRDSYGRVAGTEEASASDLPYDNTDSGMVAEDVQAALDELADEKLDDAPSDGNIYGRRDGAWDLLGGGATGTIEVTQSGHGLTVGQPVSLSGSDWIAADRGSETTTAVGLVSDVSGDKFTVTLSGRMELTTGEWDAVTGDSGGLVAGEYYCLAAGGLSGNTPSTGIVQWLLVAESSTAAVVQVGDAFTTTAGAGGYPEGTANPASPVVHDKFYRTDLNLLCYFDGTRWLTVNEYEAGPGGVDVIGATAVNANVQRWPVAGGLRMYLTRWIVSASVATTNDGANYWTVTLSSITAPFVTTALASADTSTSAANQWLTLDQVIDAPLDASAATLRASVAATGSPGMIHLLSSLRYRLIVT